MVKTLLNFRLLNQGLRYFDGADFLTLFVHKETFSSIIIQLGHTSKWAIQTILHINIIQCADRRTYYFFQ